MIMQVLRVQAPPIPITDIAKMAFRRYEELLIQVRDDSMHLGTDSNQIFAVLVPTGSMVHGSRRRGQCHTTQTAGLTDTRRVTSHR